MGSMASYGPIGCCANSCKEQARASKGLEHIAHAHVLNSSAPAAAMGTTAVESGTICSNMSPQTSPGLARTSTLRRIFASAPGLWLRKHLSRGMSTLRGSSGESFPSSEREPARDMLHTFSIANARLPTMPAISPIKVFRRALSSEESRTRAQVKRRDQVTKQPPVRDREAIIALARTRSRRRSDAGLRVRTTGVPDDRAAIEEVNASLEKLPWLRRASSF